jgi:uncharacterized protein YukE
MAKRKMNSDEIDSFVSAVGYLGQAKAAIEEATLLLADMEYQTATSYLHTGLKAYADALQAVADAIRRSKE